MLCAAALFAATTLALAWWAQGGPGGHDRSYDDVLTMRSLPNSSL